MALLAWFDALSFQAQLILVAVVCDPIGFAGGYLLAPELGVEPILGGVYLNQGESPAVYGGRESDTIFHKPRSMLTPGYLP